MIFLICLLPDISRVALNVAWESKRTGQGQAEETVLPLGEYYLTKAPYYLGKKKKYAPLPLASTEPFSN